MWQVVNGYREQLSGLESGELNCDLKAMCMESRWSFWLSFYLAQFQKLIAVMHADEKIWRLDCEWKTQVQRPWKEVKTVITER